MKNVKCRSMCQVYRKRAKTDTLASVCRHGPWRLMWVGAYEGGGTGRLEGRGGRKAFHCLPFCTFGILFHVHGLPVIQFKNGMKRKRS